MISEVFDTTRYPHGCSTDEKVGWIDRRSACECQVYINPICSTFFGNVPVFSVCSYVLFPPLISPSPLIVYTHTYIHLPKSQSTYYPSLIPRRIFFLFDPSSRSPPVCVLLAVFVSFQMPDLFQTFQTYFIFLGPLVVHFGILLELFEFRWPSSH